jgi:integrase
MSKFRQQTALCCQYFEMKHDRRYKTFDQIRKGYLKEKEIVLKTSTYRGHEGKTRLFSEWLHRNGLSDVPLRRLGNKVLHDFSIYLANERDLDRSSCIKYRDTLRVFFKYAKEIKQIKKIPLKRIVFPQKKRVCKPKYIPKDKIVALLKDIREHDFQLFIGFMLQYCSAIRPGNEMLDLKPRDFDFEGKTIKVGELKAKSGKQRYADLTDELIKYLVQYGIKEADPDHYLFGKRRTFGPKAISKNNLPHRFNKFRDAHGLDKGVKLYSAKHTGATDLINSKLISLPQLMRHLGHDRLSSTEHYIIEHGGVTNDIIKEEFKSPMVHLEAVL